jgi:hypothetical protein
MPRFGPAMAGTGRHDALNGVALAVRNSHQIYPHLPAHDAAELLTSVVGGISRRNVLGAIASEKNDCNFP